MKRLVFALFLLSVCTGVLAQQTPVSKTGDKKPRKMDPALREKLFAKTGGLIKAPAEGPSVLFLNTQKRVSDDALREVMTRVQNLLRVPAAIDVAQSSEPIAAAAKALQNTHTAAVIVIGDSSGYPMLLVAPEARWAFVNVAALAEGNISDKLLAERTEKEARRAFGYVMGAANSSQDASLLSCVKQSKDLDALNAEMLDAESLGKIMRYAQKLGIKPSRVSTYRKAVEEGWAPAPTNDIQRAIWKELKK